MAIVNSLSFRLLCMNKKTVFLLICFVGFLTSIEAQSQPDCPFCQTSVLDQQKFYEDDLVLALYSYKPIMPGHCLIIPKRHVERFEMLSDEEAAQICRVIKKVNLAVIKVFDTSPYLLLQKNGYEVGQTVPHVHFHYIPRKTGEDSTIYFLFKMFTANLLKPIEAAQMQQTVEKLQAAIE